MDRAWWQVDLTYQGEPITRITEAARALQALGLGASGIDRTEDGQWMIQMTDEEAAAYRLGKWRSEYGIEIPEP